MKELESDTVRKKNVSCYAQQWKWGKDRRVWLERVRILPYKTSVHYARLLPPSSVEHMRNWYEPPQLFIPVGFLHSYPQSPLIVKCKIQQSQHEGIEHRTLTCSVRCIVSLTLSVPFDPWHLDHSGGGWDSAGCASSASVKLENLWKRRMKNNDISWYANWSVAIESSGTEENTERITCWPRHILGPALKGKNMNGFGIRYLPNLSSINRSGSNTCARDILLS